MNQHQNNEHYQISVVIPAYNNGKHLDRTLKSVIDQTLPADEIIVVDDGSTDNTAEIVKTFSDHVHYIYQENQGASVARNRGIEAAKYNWIAFLDGDDEWIPEKLALQIDHLKRHPQLVWTTANFTNCLCADNRQGPNAPIKLIDKALEGKEYFEDYLTYPLQGGCGWTGTMLIRKDILIEAGLFRPGQLRGNDIDLWYRIAYRRYPIGFISQPLATYHMNIANSITQVQKKIDLLIELAQRHLKLSEAFDRRKDYEKVLQRQAKRWTRSLLFDNDPQEIRKIFKNFGYLLPSHFVLFIRLLIIFPKATANTCHMISRFVRYFNLRKKIIRRPSK